MLEDNNYLVLTICSPVFIPAHKLSYWYMFTDRWLQLQLALIAGVIFKLVFQFQMESWFLKMLRLDPFCD